MKCFKYTFTVLAILISSFLGNLFAQTAEQAPEIKQLDSLIKSKIKIDKINDAVKSGDARVKTRGIDPCETDFDNIGVLFKSLKSAYVSCCNRNSDYAATLRIIQSIYRIINNSKCKWDDRPIMWLAIGAYWLDYNDFVSKYNCCK